MKARGVWERRGERRKEAPSVGRRSTARLSFLLSLSLSSLASFPGDDDDDAERAEREREGRTKEERNCLLPPSLPRGGGGEGDGGGKPTRSLHGTPTRRH